MAVTIREISERAGVSIATVSKVLNGQSGVSKRAHDTVLAAAKQLNYRPNLNARHLKTGMSRTLGIIAEDLTVFNTPGIVDGIGVCCESRTFHYILGNLRFNQRFGHDLTNRKEKTDLVMEMMDEMLSKQVDGIIYIGCHSHIVAPVPEQQDTRFVCAYCYSEDSRIPSIIFDDRQAARNAGELLISKGHSRIGIIAGAKDSYHTSNRLLGYQEALYEHTIPYNPRLTRYADWEREQGYDLTPSLLADGVSAIFALNDLMAMGVIDYCSQHGIEVGRDLDLIGFDDREIASFCRPRLTTVALPLFEIGHTAATVLLDMIEHDRFPEKNPSLLGCTIIERESTGSTSPQAIN